MNKEELRKGLIEHNINIAKDLISDAKRMKPDGKSVHDINKFRYNLQYLVNRIERYKTYNSKRFLKLFGEMCEINRDLGFELYYHKMNKKPKI